MQITARLDYAIRAMLTLAADAPATLKGSELAEAQGLPMPFLHTILADLRRARLVYSVRGTAGGYGLTRPADTITLADIMSGLDGDILGVRGLPAAHTRYYGVAASLHDVWLAADEAVRKVLRDTTLADLVNDTPTHLSRNGTS